MANWRQPLWDMKRQAEKDGNGGQCIARYWNMTLNHIECSSCGRHSVVTAMWVGGRKSNSDRAHAMEMAAVLGAPMPTISRSVDPPGSLAEDDFDRGALIWHWKKDTNCQERDDTMRVLDQETPAAEYDYDPSFDPPPVAPVAAQNPALASQPSIPSIGGAFGLRSHSR